MKDSNRSSYWALLAIIVAVCAGLLAWSFHLGKGDATAADWLSALATLFGFAAAVIAGWYLAGSDARERQRDKALDDERKRAQASLVAFWYDVRIDPLRGGIDARVEATPWNWFGIWIRNASELPIFDVRWEVFVNEELLGTCMSSGPGSGRPGVVPPADEPRFNGFGEVVGWKLEALRPPPDDGGGIADPPVPVIAFYFTDAAGQAWLRMSDGALIEGQRKSAARWGA